MWRRGKNKSESQYQLQEASLAIKYVTAKCDGAYPWKLEESTC